MPTGAFSVLGVDGSFGSALIPLFRASLAARDFCVGRPGLARLADGTSVDSRPGHGDL